MVQTHRATQALQKKLDALREEVGADNCRVGICERGAAIYAASPNEAQGGTGAGDLIVSAGCCAKLLTATLMRHTLLSGKARLSGAVNDYLNLDPEAHRYADGITIQHLVEHTHGLSDGGVATIARAGDGRIDVPALGAQLSAVTRLANPGELYSYGNMGMWLCCAVMESVWGAQYATLLDELLLDPLGIEPVRLGNAPVCGAIGGGLGLRVADWLVFLHEAVARWREEDFCSASRLVALPGCAILEQGVACGWHRYAGGWWGHNSVLGSDPAFMRVHPEQEVAVVVASRGYLPGGLAGRLFNDRLPDLVRIRFPRINPGAALEPEDQARYTGRYVGNRVTAEVSGYGANQLQLTVHYRDSSSGASAADCAQLKFAGDGVFYPLGGMARKLGFVQFIQPTRTGFRFIWDGQSVWRSIAELPRASV